MNGLTLPLNTTLVDMDTDYIDADIVLTKATVKGLDSISHISVLEMVPGANFTMNFSITIERISLELNVNATLSTDTHPQTPIIPQGNDEAF